MFSSIRRLTRRNSIPHSFESYSTADNKNAQQEEPNAPVVKTDIPGPNTEKLIKTLKTFQKVPDIEVFASYDNSRNNFLADVDGNFFLDLNMQQNSIPLGYNNPDLLKILEDPLNLKYIVNRPVSGVYPGDYWSEKIQYIIEKVSPSLPNVATFQCECSAVENAFKAAMMASQKHQRAGMPISKEELESAKNSQPPGCANLAIMSFQNADHGSTIGALSASHADGLSKLDVPAFDWPVAKFPTYKYPLEQNHCYNETQDVKSLETVEDLLDHWEKKGVPVVGIVVEPIQNICTSIASPKFFQKLQDIANSRGIYLLFDETKTGCGATGKFWCHEHFCLKLPPDAVIFGGKTQLPGFFHSLDLSPQESNRIFDPWMGDPSKLLMFEAIINLTEKVNLMEHVRVTGNMLKQCLLDLEADYFDLIHSTRGMGTFLGFDAQCPPLRDSILHNLKKKGIICGKCGEKSISLRPSLTFSEKHVALFVDRLERVIKETAVVKPDKKKDDKAFGPVTKPFSRKRQEPSCATKTATGGEGRQPKVKCRKHVASKKQSIGPRSWAKKLRSHKNECVEAETSKSAVYETCVGKGASDKNRKCELSGKISASETKDKRDANSLDSVDNACSKSNIAEHQQSVDCTKKITERKKNVNHKEKSVCPKPWANKSESNNNECCSQNECFAAEASKSAVYETCVGKGASDKNSKCEVTGEISACETKDERDANSLDSVDNACIKSNIAEHQQSVDCTKKITEREKNVNHKEKSICPRPWANKSGSHKNECCSQNECLEAEASKSAVYETCVGKGASDKNSKCEATGETSVRETKDERANSLDSVGNACSKSNIAEHQQSVDYTKKITKGKKNINNKEKSICPRPWANKSGSHKNECRTQNECFEAEASKSAVYETCVGKGASDKNSKCEVTGETSTCATKDKREAYRSGTVDNVCGKSNIVEHQQSVDYTKKIKKR